MIITRGRLYKGRGQVPIVSSNKAVVESCLKSKLWEDKDLERGVLVECCQTINEGINN